ncbi:MAG: hypothetical protein JWO32_2111 [Bacteroidetes bacterium]|nr:hypothetical protein [Bacteroidota bacterium]
MSENLKPEERELIKLVGFFKKRAERLMEEKKVDEDYKQLIETCDKLVAQLEMHARNRDIVLGEREQLKSLVKDNATCPKCSSNANLKLIGTDVNDKGWKSNKYKCRKCNIEFVWNAPNNPWDMIPYVENFLSNLETKLSEEPDEALKQHTADVLSLMKANLDKLKPVVEASDLDFAELEEREREMSEMVHKFKKHLLIEKIRMED